MDVQVEQVSANEKRLSFTVPASKVNKELSRAFANLGRQVNMPGFRKGKVPRNILESRWGASIRSEVAANLINSSFQDAASDLEYFGSPNVDKGDLEGGNDFSFTITVEVRPELELGSYTGVEVVYPKVEVTDEQVQARVDARLQSQASLAEVEDRDEVAQGDFVLAELDIKDGDESVHAHPGTMLNTADERYYTGLETALVGAKRNESTTLDVTFSDEAMIEELKGRTLSVTATVSSIQAMSTPALDDDMASQLGFEGGADGMRAAVQLQIQEAGDAQARNQARANLLNVLIDANEFSAPAGLIDQQLKALLEEIRIQRAYRGENPRDIQFSDSELADYRTRATFAAKASLILDHVASAESIGVEDNDLEAKYQEIADARGQRVEAIKGYFVKENAIEDLRERLLEEKTLDWLLERATLVDPKPVEAADEEAVEAAPAKPKAKKAKAKAAPAEAAPAADAPKAELEGRPYKGHVITGKSGSYQIDGEGPMHKTLKDAKAAVE